MEQLTRFGVADVLQDIGTQQALLTGITSLERCSKENGTNKALRDTHTADVLRLGGGKSNSLGHDQTSQAMSKEHKGSCFVVFATLDQSVEESTGGIEEGLVNGLPSDPATVVAIKQDTSTRDIMPYALLIFQPIEVVRLRPEAFIRGGTQTRHCDDAVYLSDMLRALV